MKLCASYGQTRLGLALVISGDFDRDFHTRFLYFRSPYSFSAVDPDIKRVKPDFVGYSKYLIGSEREGKDIVEQLRKTFANEGHTIDFELS